MQQKSHQDRLKAFSALVSPIARMLDAPIQHVGRSASPPDSALSQPTSTQPAEPGEVSGFFKDGAAAQAQATQRPLHRPEVQPEGSENRCFELVRQELIQHLQEHFASLPAKIQMMSKVGGLIYLERGSLEQRVYHLVCDGQLIAMLDRKREKLYVRQDMSGHDFSDLHCQARPDAAAKSTSGLEQVTIHDCVWLYATHDPEAMLDLPAAAGTHLMMLRRLPKISPKLLNDNQMTLIRQLLIRPQSFDQLSQGYTRNQFRALVRDMACMLLTRSIDFTTIAPILNRKTTRLRHTMA